MKKVFLILSIIALSFAAQAQKKPTTYFTLGTSLVDLHFNHGHFQPKASYGGVVGNTSFGVLVQTQGNESRSARRNWFTGVEVGQNIPIDPTINFVVAGEALLDVTRKTNNYLSLTPQVGFGFEISPKVTFQALYGAQFKEQNRYKIDEVENQVDLGFQFNF